MAVAAVPAPKGARAGVARQVLCPALLLAADARRLPASQGTEKQADAPADQLAGTKKNSPGMPASGNGVPLSSRDSTGSGRKSRADASASEMMIRRPDGATHTRPTRRATRSAPQGEVRRGHEPQACLRRTTSWPGASPLLLLLRRLGRTAFTVRGGVSRNHACERPDTDVTRVQQPHADKVTSP